MDNEDQNLLPNLLLFSLALLWAERTAWYFGVDMARKMVFHPFEIYRLEGEVYYQRRNLRSLQYSEGWMITWSVSMKVVLSALIAPIAVMMLPLAVLAEVKTQVVEYKHGSIVLEGYLAYDDAVQGKRPGVLVVHEWTGLGDYVKRRAEQLAKLGYVAFAIDMYGKGIRPINPKDAATQATIYRSNRPLMRDRANAGLAILQQNSLTDPNRIAAIGYCFGGGTVLELARSGAPVVGVVSFHGNLDTPNPADAKNIKGKVLVLHGASDPYVPPAQVQAFEKEMTNAGVDWQLISYGGVVHSFTNPDAGNDPSKGAAYDAAADKRSFAAMRQFFAEIFGRSPQPQIRTSDGSVHDQGGGRRVVLKRVASAKFLIQK